VQQAVSCLIIAGLWFSLCRLRAGRVVWQDQRSQTMKISVETLVNAPLDRVWSAYTTPEDIKQ
jgi:hypothetical protein